MLIDVALPLMRSGVKMWRPKVDAYYVHMPEYGDFIGMKYFQGVSCIAMLAGEDLVESDWVEYTGPA